MWEISVMVYQGKRRALVQAAEAASLAPDNQKHGDTCDAKETIPAPKTFEPLPNTAQVTRIREKLRRKHGDVHPPLETTPVLLRSPTPPPKVRKPPAESPEAAIPTPPAKTEASVSGPTPPPTTTTEIPDPDFVTPPPKGKRKLESILINKCGRDVDPKRAKVAVEAQMKRLESREKSKSSAC
ncbi:hypothetical protein AC1031_011898 [Aphanomyces cochlioides]|nr:hypothetical protein AC1031_011898 [Aphanomyces cochlioides]